MILQLRNAYKAYENKQILKNVSIKISKGQRVALLGANGTGKSTLLKILAGLEETNSGALFLDDQKIDGPGTKLVPGHPEIALVNQQTKFDRNLTVYENIILPIKFSDKEYLTKIVGELANVFRLKDFLHQYPNQVSGGQLQRAGIAKALISKPSFLLLDEPFSNQDISNSALLKNDILEIADALNITIVFVTHIASDALSVANKILVLHEGRIVQADSPENIYFNPNSLEVATISGELMSGDDFFAKTFGLNCHSKIYLRPQVFEMVGEGEGVRVVVDRKYFYGENYKYYFMLNQNQYFFFSPVEMEINKEVYLKLRPKGLIQFN